MTTDTHAETMTSPGVLVTERAAREISRYIEEQELDRATVYLRVGVKGGGCSGFSYILDLTESRKDTDETWEQHGIRVICDPKSLLYLDGTQVDFKETIMERGFVFSNPNATSSCGCGSSFNV